jgi:hypothetical protein
MWIVRSPLQPRIERGADSAGLALACAYSSSDEYEAAIIAERRAAGRYGQSRKPAVLMLAAVTAVIAIAVAMP